MNPLADLHVHTTYSDGALSPFELIKKAKSVGLEVISLTDHDSVGGVEEAIEIGRECNVKVVAGVELSAILDGIEVHILGYFIDYQNNVLLETLTHLREGRLKRAERIVDKLHQMNVPLSMDSVLANVRGESVGRPHIANALVSGGHAESYHQAFRKYIGEGRPAFEKKSDLSPEEVVQLIAEVGGLSFLAHPGRSVDENLLFQLIQAGLDGIEVTHPSHTADIIHYFRGIVNEYCLLESGGSDFHGGQRDDDQFFGQVGVSTSMVDIMRRRLSPC